MLFTHEKIISPQILNLTLITPLGFFVIGKYINSK